MKNDLELSITNQESVLLMAKALNSPIRLAIFNLLLAETTISIKDIAKTLNQPLSSTVINVNLLEDAGLIVSETRFTQNGKSRYCRKACNSIFIDTTLDKKQYKQPTQLVKTTHEIRISSYFACYDVCAPCGMATANDRISAPDDTDVFFIPERIDAQIIWFTRGVLEYRVSKKNLKGTIKELSLSFEACSEVPFYQEDAKSDITVWINDVEIGTWVCPGDFGGRKGQLTPDYWPKNHTQFGLLTNWHVNDSFTTLNSKFLSYTRISELKLDEFPYISIKIGIKENTQHKAGINLFGSKFGDHQQDILLKVLRLEE